MYFSIRGTKILSKMIFEKINSSGSQHLSLEVLLCFVVVVVAFSSPLATNLQYTPVHGIIALVNHDVTHSHDVIDSRVSARALKGHCDLDRARQR